MGVQTWRSEKGHGGFFIGFDKDNYCGLAIWDIVNNGFWTFGYTQCFVIKFRRTCFF